MTWTTGRKRRNRRGSAAPRARRNTCLAPRCLAISWRAASATSAIPATRSTKTTCRTASVAFQGQQVLGAEVDIDRAAELRRGEVWIVEGVEQDRVFLQLHPD